MLKAASLYYSVFFLLIVGVFCYLILNSYTFFLRMDDYYDMQDRMLLNNQSAVAYAEQYYSDLDNQTEKIFFSDYSIKTRFIKSKWGYFEKLEINSIFKKDTLSQCFLIGKKQISNMPALYLRNNNENLNLSGNTFINGDIYIPELGIKNIEINSCGVNNFSRSSHSGKIYTSKKNLPRVNEVNLEYSENWIYSKIETFKDNEILNSFRKVTKVVLVEGYLRNYIIKGNIIIKSNDTLHIDSSTYLEDVILDAPKVVFHSNFRGNAQVFAKNGVVLENNTKLKYPSIIVSKSDETSELIFNNQSSFSGLIYFQTLGLSQVDRNTLIIEENATIEGNIYCEGSLFLKGKVLGSVFTSSLQYKNNEFGYANLICGGEIFSNPEEKKNFFFQLDYLENFNSSQALLLKQI